MKIGFVAHNFVYGNGQGRINYEIARHAARQGHRVTLLADQVDASLTAEANIQWEPIAHSIRRPNLIGGWLAARAADARLGSANDFDLIVGAGYTLTTPHDISLCQFVHGAWLKSPVHVAKLARGPWAWYQWTYTRANQHLESKAYLAAGMVVAPSEKIRAELLDIGVRIERTTVIYNGVDLDEFCPRSTAEADASERTELGLPPPDAQRPLAVFAGDIRTPRKNLDTVLKSLGQIPHLHLAVVGAIENSPFPAMAKQLGVADRVTFMGFRKDINRIMRAADLFVFPSRYEAGTLVLTEAAASGLPLVTAATAGGAEVFGPEVAQIIADPDDIASLTNAIKHFAENPIARQAASRSARVAAEQLTWARMAARYLSLFESTYLNKRSATLPNFQMPQEAVT